MHLMPRHRVPDRPLWSVSQSSSGAGEVMSLSTKTKFMFVKVVRDELKSVIKLSERSTTTSTLGSSSLMLFKKSSGIALCILFLQHMDALLNTLNMTQSQSMLTPVDSVWHEEEQK
mmetsp:Transcript_6910/g.10456  ORF Transcript_6910/g.10456 Transcript_6910/m.10456 type:complete len:116 (-) Transcript_6910:7-354(-)